MAHLLGPVFPDRPLRALMLESPAVVSAVAVHEAVVLLLAGAAHLQRRGVHLRGARPALLQDRQLREPQLQRAPPPVAADDEPRRAQVR